MDNENQNSNPEGETTNVDTTAESPVTDVDVSNADTTNAYEGDTNNTASNNEATYGDTSSNESFLADDTPRQGSHVDDYTSTGDSYNSNSTMLDEKPKKMGKGAIIAIIAAVIVLIAVVSAFAAKDRIVNSVQKTVLSPRDYFRQVEKKQFDEAFDAIEKNYNTSLDILKSDEMTANFSLNAKVGSSLSTLLAVVPSDIDLAKLKSAAVDFTYATKAKENLIDGKIKINDAEIASGNAYIDFDNKHMYAQAPFISEDYLDLSQVFTSADSSKINSITTKDIVAIYPETKEMIKFLNTYSDIVIDSFENVEKKSTTLKANGVEQNCEALTATLSTKEALNLALKVLDEAKDDEVIVDVINNLNEFLKKMDESASLDLDKDSYAAKVDQLKEQIKSMKDSETFEDKKFLTLVIYVDGSGDVIGSDVTVDANGDELKAHSYMTVAAKKFGYDAAMELSGQSLFTIEGKGDYNLKDFNGTFDIKIPEANMTVTAELKNCNTVNMMLGEFKGDIILSTDYDSLKDYQIKISLDTSAQKLSANFTAMGNDQEWGSVGIDYSIEKGSDIKVPDSSANYVDVSDESSFSAYLGQFDSETYINDVSEKIGIEFTAEQINDMIKQFSSMLPGSVGSGDINEDYSYSKQQDYDSEDYDYDSEDYDYDSEDYDYDSEDYDYDSEDYDYDSEDFNWDEFETEEVIDESVDDSL